MRRTLPVVLLASALLLTACGTATEGNGSGPEEQTSAAASPSETSPEPSPEPGPEEEPTSPEEPAGAEEPADAGAPTGELPGEIVDIPPYGDAIVAVIGVEAGSGLNYRPGPGMEFEVAGTLEPLGVRPAIGETRRREDGSHWTQIMVHDGWFYWVSLKHIAQLGETTDVTADLAELPSAATVEEAGLLVARQRTADQPPSAETVVVDGPVDGDVGEVVIDVVGLGDDAIAGERLHVFTEQTGRGHTVRTVEATLLCARGVSEDGLCV